MGEPAPVRDLKKIAYMYYKSQFWYDFIPIIPF